MTRIGDTAEGEASQNQKQWLYDVTVYPKNSIAKGTVKLVKLGKQGDKTTKLADVLFTLYRKSDTKDEYTPVQTAVIARCKSLDLDPFFSCARIVQAQFLGIGVIDSGVWIAAEEKSNRA